jgi:hypothetical protein
MPEPGQSVEIDVRGPLPDHVLAALPGFVALGGPVDVVLRGRVTDDDDLSEVVHALRDSGIELRGLRWLTAP